MSNNNVLSRGMIYSSIILCCMILISVFGKKTIAQSYFYTADQTAGTGDERLWEWCIFNTPGLAAAAPSWVSSCHGWLRQPLVGASSGTSAYPWEVLGIRHRKVTA